MLKYKTELPENLEGYDAYVDTETVGLYGEIRLIQVYVTPHDQPDGELYIIDTHQWDQDDRHWGVYDTAQRLQTADCIIGHNFLYDMHCFKNYGAFFPEALIEDTFLLARLSKPRWEKYSLDRCMENVYGYDPYERHGLDKKRLQRSKWGESLTDEMLLYAAIDVAYLPPLYHAVKDARESFSYRLDKRTAVAFVECRGVLPLDITAAQARRIYNNNQIARWNVPINVNSYQQVRPWIGSEESDDVALARLAVLCCNPEMYKKTTQYAVKTAEKPPSGWEKITTDGRLDWDKIDDDGARAYAVRTVRSLRKQNSFINDYLNRADSDGYVKGHLGLSPITGRSSCAEANLQQVPSALKDLFASPSHYMIYADFSNLELRTFAAVVGDETMARLLRDDVDLHRYTAAFLFDKPIEQVTSKERKIAKVINFSSLYGAGYIKKKAILLKWTGIDVPDEEMMKLHVRWYELYPRAWKWHRESAKLCNAGELTRTPLGRAVHADRLNMWLNVPIQGAGAEIAKLALSYMREKEDLKHLWMFVHDSYTWGVTDLESAKHIAKTVGDAMAQAWVEYMPLCTIKDIPMPVEVDVAAPGTHWADLQEGKGKIVCRYETTGIYTGEKERL